MMQFTEAKAKAETWYSLAFLENEKRELSDILKNEQKILEHFGSNLKFGTAGMRGIMALGSACMNRYTVAQAGLGMANFLKKGKVVLGYDVRKNSKEFAEILVKIFLAKGIEVLFFAEITPTPLIPFAVQKESASVGIVITASHNPPQYNGIKVYSANGAQIIPPIDEEIALAINQVPIEEAFAFVKDIHGVEKKPNYALNFKSKYFNFIKENVLSNKYSNTTQKVPFSFVYTPLYGAAGKLMQEAIDHFGFGNSAIYVLEQMEANGNFPNLKAPNPELEESYELAKKIALKNNAALILANDGDGDRLGVMVNSKEGKFTFLNGNELGVLLAYYLLLSRQKQNLLTKKELLISSVVSSPLLQKIAKHFGCEYRQTLTGFKWMGNLAYELEKKENLKFLFAYEEAYGYAIGGERDKDGITAALLLLEAAIYCHNLNQTLLDLLDEIYSIWGYHKEGSWQLEYSSAKQKSVYSVLEGIRQKPPKNLLGEDIHFIKDFYHQKVYYPNKVESLVGFPKEDLIFIQTKSYWLALRPSGTEPKIKAYFGVCLNPSVEKEVAQKEALAAIKELKTQVEKIFLSNGYLF